MRHLPGTPVGDCRIAGIMSGTAFLLAQDMALRDLPDRAGGARQFLSGHRLVRRSVAYCPRSGTRIPAEAESVKVSPRFHHRHAGCRRTLKGRQGQRRTLVYRIASCP